MTLQAFGITQMQVLAEHIEHHGNQQLAESELKTKIQKSPTPTPTPTNLHSTVEAADNFYR